MDGCRCYAMAAAAAAQPALAMAMAGGIFRHSSAGGRKGGERRAETDGRHGVAKAAARSGRSGREGEGRRAAAATPDGRGRGGQGEAPLLVGADSAAACFEKATEVIWREGEELYNKLKMVCLLGLDCVNRACHSCHKIRWFGNSLNRGLSQQLRPRTAARLSRRRSFAAAPFK